MEGGVARGKGSLPPSSKPSKFSVYQNPVFSAALTTNSLRPSKSTLLSIFFLSSASAVALVSISSRENKIINKLRFQSFSREAAYLFAKAIQITVGLVFIGAMSALFKAISLRKSGNVAGVPVLSPSKENKDQPHLSNRQLGLLGIKPKVEQIVTDSSKKPPKSKPYSASSSLDILFPLHQPMMGSNIKPKVVSDESNSSSGKKLNSYSTPSKSQGSPSSLYLVPAASSPLRSVQTSPVLDSVSSTPWSSKRGSAKDITTEEQLERFLAEVDEKITESAGKLSTPPPTISGFGMKSPNTFTSSVNTSGTTTKSTPLRTVRMSPGSQKFSTPPKKGESELPPSMTLEEAIEFFKHLGIYPQIELWRDRLRQWFSSVLVNPLLNKIETSHIQVMQAAAKLGISITISQVGSEISPGGTAATVSSTDRTKEWQPAVNFDEDGVLHQLRATLSQALDASMSNFQLPNPQQSLQQNPMTPVIRQCVDAITEHQRLQALMKGELIKGLLPQSSVRADYMVQRIRDLAEGTCLKNYEYIGSGDMYDKKNKKWTAELPSDSHLLLYLFCAFLEHPKWMLHVDPTSYTGAQSSKNPLFLGILPPKESFPEKYIAVISGVPSVLHPGSCIVVVGRQSPPIFALYWDKKLQFSFQGRTAIWDSILILCHEIKVRYGGVVRGMHLGSSALSILPIVESETED
ncbi:hypothetical protein HS088_TW21G00204 [Tripterygium wilfordii]|uniref:Transmembrane protein n=1 Tax=Tripterygium wilfordii TaxID=458696 RepID=A0A7J7C1T6_TRIWF|nr:uncharacterized protein LOC119990203 [Tripterygium wilfordii]KAF5728061.1 hypothetical protein HS088_TW21G00204 [Tripterygium wilfordii]